MKSFASLSLPFLVPVAVFLCLALIAAKPTSRVSQHEPAAAIVCGPGHFQYSQIGDMGTGEISPPAHGFSLVVEADAVTVFFVDGSFAPAFGVGDSWSWSGQVNGQPNIIGFQANGVVGSLGDHRIEWHSF